MLLGVVSNQLLQVAGLLREGDLSVLPRLQEAPLPGDNEPALASLEVDHQSLEPVGDDQNYLGLLGSAFRAAQIRDQDSSTANAVAITSASRPLAITMRRVSPPRTASSGLAWS